MNAKRRAECDRERFGHAPQRMPDAVVCLVLSCTTASSSGFVPRRFCVEIFYRGNSMAVRLSILGPSCRMLKLEHGKLERYNLANPRVDPFRGRLSSGCLRLQDLRLAFCTMRPMSSDVGFAEWRVP